ncbi:YaiI/YqxD family protein [Roseburia sp. 1XD42-34]|nr:YaiI/YqxD family protein [Roseburia sp. 1XD42-34]NBJ67976.1 YaiI/YqxD family protein [Roseburia sp. 1XD42-34]RKI82422.1 YaiI/YqxD family protein [Clostridium sp. 1xD42-85]
MQIYVDADACPVKDQIIKLAREFQIPVTLVQSFSHYSSKAMPEGAETIYVDSGADAADYRIMKLVSQGDVIVTQDYGLASLGLAKRCDVVHHKGFIYTDENIDSLLQTRYLNAMARKSGKRTKGPKAFSEEDRKLFETRFRSLLEQRRRARG